jgi:hypothetical protein
MASTMKCFPGTVSGIRAGSPEAQRLRKKVWFGGGKRPLSGWGFSFRAVYCNWPMYTP